jgi:tRNA(adenine34) deaminase
VTAPADDERFMRQALGEAGQAAASADVPIGCVVVRDGRIVGRGFNQRELLQDPTAHAEIIAITAAAAEVGSWRLERCTLYVTLEPCAMCAGAIVLGRVPRLVFGASDPKAGACGSLMNIADDARLNHRAEITRGVLAEECGEKLRSFFQALRQ